MSQHDFNIANQSFPATRTDINDAILAIVSNSSGDTEPSTTYANQWWYETDTNILKIRNEANNGWVDVITLDASMTASASELSQLDAITRGSIIYGNASGATARLAAGAASTVLTSDGTDISWAAAGGGGGGMVYLASSGAISNAATVSFTQFDASKYDHYQFWLQDVIPQNDAVYLYCHVSTDGGSSYDTTNGNYHLGGTGGTDATGLPVARSGAIGSDTNEFGVNGPFMLFSPHRTSYTKSQTLTVHDRDQLAYQQTSSTLSAGVHLVLQDVDAVQFKMGSGNIESGEIVMYGIANGT
jgi:hypothetical protein